MAANEFTSDFISRKATCSELASYLAQQTGCDADTAERVAWDLIKHYVLPNASLPECPLRQAVERRLRHECLDRPMAADPLFDKFRRKGA